MTAGPKSAALYARATELMPAGVNSPVRAFRAVGGDHQRRQSSRQTFRPML